MIRAKAEPSFDCVLALTTAMTVAVSIVLIATSGL